MAFWGRSGGLTGLETAIREESMRQKSSGTCPIMNFLLLFSLGDYLTSIGLFQVFVRGRTVPMNPIEEMMPVKLLTDLVLLKLRSRLPR